MAATILETAVERKPPPGNHPGRGNLACVTHAHRKDTFLMDTHNPLGVSRIPPVGRSRAALSRGRSPTECPI